MIDLVYPNPFSRYGWCGQCISLDDAPNDIPEDDDIIEVIGQGDTGEGWDGNSAGIVLLKDGRYVGWSTWWGPTGSGFCDDAYGGDEDFYVSYDLGIMIRRGLDAEGRRLCGLALPSDLPEEMGDDSEDDLS